MNVTWIANFSFEYDCLDVKQKTVLEVLNL